MLKHAWQGMYIRVCIPVALCGRGVITAGMLNRASAMSGSQAVKGAR